MYMHHFTRSPPTAFTKPQNQISTERLTYIPTPARLGIPPIALFGCLAWRLDYFCGEPGGMIELDGPHPPPRRAFSTPPLAFGSYL